MKVEVALDVIQMKISKYIRENRGKDKKEFVKELRRLIRERNEIYALNVETINKVFNVYAKELD